MAAPPPPLPEVLVEEILLRFPPDDPARLVQAALVCKPWCAIVSGAGFRRRYRNLHRAPPMLGFFCDPSPRDGEGFSTSFDPASTFRPVHCFRPPMARHRRTRPVDARHGRVLLRVPPVIDGLVLRGFGLAVWCPISGHQVVLPRPKDFCDMRNWKATVLCAAPAGSCDHLDCHRGHFIVVLIGDYPRGMLSSVYSSQTGVWSETRHLNGHLGEYSEKRSAHVGNALYCRLAWGIRILKYDLGTREFSVMEPPPLLLDEEFVCSDKTEFTTMEDGQLGLAVLRQSTLYIQSADKEFGWGGTKIIDLEKCGNYVPSTTRPSLIGFAGDIGLVFIKAGNNGILSVDIRSAQMKVVEKRPYITWIIPYINFCTPAIGMPSKDDKPRAGASMDVQSCRDSNVEYCVVCSGHLFNIGK